METTCTCTHSVRPKTAAAARIAYNEDGRRIGEGHPRARVKDDDVRRMRDLHEPPNGWTCARIAAHFGVPFFTVKKYLNYQRRAQTPARFREL